MDNQSGKWLGLGRSTLSLDLAGGLNNTKGLIQHQGDISLNTHRAIINNHQSTLRSLAGDIAIQAQSRFENEKGNLIAFKDLVLQHEGVNNQAG
ncbi:hypothetical protein, partial [Chelonobacter oris]|uniref:hypothetical protein n=1 Tax=Chelonobacter oris TaxID=505317 RepID=UPI0024477070